MVVKNRLRFLLLSTLVILVFVGSFVSYKHLTSVVTQAPPPAAFDFQAYQVDLVSKYQLQSQIYGQILRSAKIEDVELSGIQTHVSQWRPSTLTEVAEIEELHSFLETSFSKHLDHLNRSKIKDLSLRRQLDALLKIDLEIRSQRTVLQSSLNQLSQR